MWDKILPLVSALLGVTVGSATLIFSGWAESQKQVEIKRSDALIQFAEAAMLPNDNREFDTEFAKKKSGLAVFASDEIIKNYAAYQNCGNKNKDSECAVEWAKVINAMRASIGQTEIDVPVLVELYF